MKRIATIQDISCLGKCSLTAALPIISAMGIETCVIPTAVLSTHTMFTGYTFRDLTDDMPLIKEHWLREGFRFDALYTGYLGSERQLSIVSEYFSAFKTDENLIIVDPVMGDNGSLYKGFNEDFALSMGRLCGDADIILPNLTEAAFMLGLDYIGEGYDERYIRELLKRLTGLGARTAVLTGVSLQSGKIGVASYDSEKDDCYMYFHDRVSKSYHGTGDVFASTVVGALMNGIPFPRALQTAADYTADCIRITAEDPDGINYGVYFEALIPQLISVINENK